MNDETGCIEKLFDAALQLPSAEARAAYLHSACGTDVNLRQHVEALLKAHEGAGTFLEHAPPGARAASEAAAACVANSPTSDTVPADASSPHVPPAEKAGDHIDRYRLLEKLGEGGFGVVYMA